MSEPVPDAVRRAAYDAFDWRVPGVKVAHLFYDSVVDGPRRPVTSPRWLRFRSGDDAVHLVVHPTTTTRAVSVSVQVAAGEDVVLHVGSPGSRTRVRCDARGRACVTGLRSGLLDVLVCRPGESAPVLKTACIWV